jgi:hypothetical protein
MRGNLKRGLAGLPQRLLGLVCASGNDGPGKAANAVAEFAQGLGCEIAERVFFPFDVTESRLFHLPDGGAEAFGTYLVDINEAEGLGKRDPIGSTLHELDLGGHFAKYCAQIHFGERSLRNRTGGKNGRASGEREPPNDSNELPGIDGE